MAKWGEGDPRWIVEERPDATNVNNWHWTEKNADQWSQKKFKELFAGVHVDDPKVGKVTITEVEKCAGEARVNNRKAKLIFFYEWEIDLKWEGKVNGSDEEVKGKVTIPNMSEEHTNMKDVDIDVEIISTPKTAEATQLKEMLRKGTGANFIRERLQKYVDSLKVEYSQGVILPGKDSGVKASPKPNGSQDSNVAAMKKLDVACTSSTSGTKLDLATIDMEERFKCTGQELYNVLTQKEMIQVFTGAAVNMTEAKAGAEFQLLGGNIEGKFVSLTPFSKVVQKWRLKSWPSGHFSDVEFVISQSKEDTCLQLKQTGVPRKELESTRQGWARYYVEAIKRSFGFGAALF